MNAKDNAGTDSKENHTGTAKGYQSFAANDTRTIQEIRNQLREDWLRLDNAALRLSPMHCGCQEPTCGDCCRPITQCEHKELYPIAHQCKIVGYEVER